MTRVFSHQSSAAPDLELMVPEDDLTFRLARLLLLLDVAGDEGRTVRSLDRLGYYEFFADNPFIILDSSVRSDSADCASLALAGFSRAQLSYASLGQRFASRRKRLQHDLAMLVAFGLVRVSNAGYEATLSGRELAGNFRSAYADAYRRSASIVLRRLSALSNRGLQGRVETWLGRSWLLLDLLDDVRDAEAPVVEVPTSVTSSGGDGDGNSPETA